MNYRRVIYIVLFLFMQSVFANGQDYRHSGFSKPMNLPFNLAGSFGEPRPDHFHSGIDIKTNGMEGEPVLAIGDGYISRIRVSPYGYGKAIYITHPNGFTSVYGHLSRFYGKIEAYIHAQHYRLQASELDLTLDSTVFPLRQNDTIAFSGNTGGSTAPHLHFEIRNTKTEHALNPLDFYPESFYVDTIPPQINKIYIKGYLDTFFTLKSTDLIMANACKDSFFDVNINCKLFTFSLEGFDKQDSSKNKNGIKKIEVYKDGNLVFKYDLTEIDFEITRMCNAFFDYSYYDIYGEYAYNCYQFQNNLLSLYQFKNTNLFKINNNDTAYFNIYCYDYNDNKTELKIKLINGNMNEESIEQYYNFDKKRILYNINDSILLNTFKCKWNKNTFYDNFYLQLRDVKADSNDLSDFYHIQLVQNTIPLQKPAKIEFKSSLKKNRNKIVIVRQDDKGKETALKTTFDKTKFYADTKELGTFYLKYDTTKPTIILDSVTLSTQYSVLNTIKVKISDNLSGIDTYNGYIDNHWVNFYYDAKNDVLLYNPDEYCPKGEHLLKISVTDNVGNKNSITQKINY